MRLNHLVRIRVTKTEKEGLKEKCKELGFPTLNPYLRWNILKNTEITEELQEIKFLLKSCQDG